MKDFIKEKIKESAVYNRLDRIERQQTEILKGLIFNNTISDSKWLKYKSFSPGSWAADYGLLYTLYRVLNGIKPNSLLEFGLGQSSKMLYQYASYYGVKAVTYEHDSDWAKFFNEGKDGDYDVNIKIIDLDTVKYKEFETITYKDIEKDLEDRKFDFVLVDGPFGSSHYSRSEVISVTKNNLSDRFCIIMDDTERDGEKETIQEVFSVLNSCGIDFCHCTYRSTKNHTLICSNDLKFLTSL